MIKNHFLTLLVILLVGCAAAKTTCDQRSDAPVSDGIYEVAVKEGVSHQEVVDSLKSLAEGMNFVSPASFPIGEHIQERGIDPQGIKEVYSYCNLSMGTEIFLDHPEFLVFAPCRIAVYEKTDSNHVRKLFIGLARPTYDLKNIKNPSARAQKAAELLEKSLIELVNRASEGDF